MGQAIQWLRSLFFIIQMYLVMAIFAVVYLPWMALSKDGALAACHHYARYVKWSMGWMVGLKYEVRGPVPTEECLVAAKHQSFLDILLIFSALPRPKFIMKSELLWAPILGQYAYRLGCVPVNRGRRTEAIGKMVADVEAGRARPGQLCIYPQGTRVAPGAKVPYKVGTAILYEQLNQPAVFVGANVGLFWPKRGIVRHPGTAIVEFHAPVDPGLSRDAFMEKMEEVIETSSDALMAEAGGPRP